VRITGPAHFAVRDAVLDSGADDTVFPDGIAAIIGLDLTLAVPRKMFLAGRGVVNCRFAPAQLRITDGVSETYEWDAVVGFVPVPLRCPLLGYAGFFQFFDVHFHGADGEITVVPSWAFAGGRI
jgi:hypothetical protein